MLQIYEVTIDSWDEKLLGVILWLDLRSDVKAEEFEG